MTLFRRAALLHFAALLLSVSTSGAEPSRSVVSLTVTEDRYDGGRIYLPVRINNVMGVMRLDTGASSTRVRLAPWNSDLPSLGQSISTGASGATVQCDDLDAQKFELIADQGNNIARTKYRITRCPAGDGDDLLGLDFFNGARFSLDIDRRALVFFGEATASGRPKPFRRLGPDQRLVGIDLRLGRTASVGLFDSGAEVSAIDQQFVRKHRRLFVAVNAKPGASGVAGARIASKMYKIKSLDFGSGRVLRNLYAISYDFGGLRAALGADVSFLIGYNVIKKFNWDFDFRTPDSPTWNAQLK